MRTHGRPRPKPQNEPANRDCMVQGLIVVSVCAMFLGMLFVSQGSSTAVVASTQAAVRQEERDTRTNVDRDAGKLKATGDAIAKAKAQKEELNEELDILRASLFRLEGSIDAKKAELEGLNNTEANAESADGGGGDAKEEQAPVGAVGGEGGEAKVDNPPEVVNNEQVELQGVDGKVDATIVDDIDAKGDETNVEKPEEEAEKDTGPPRYEPEVPKINKYGKKIIYRFTHVMNAYYRGPDHPDHNEMLLVNEGIQRAIEYAGKRGIEVEFFAVGFPEDEPAAAPPQIFKASLQTSTLDEPELQYHIDHHPDIHRYKFPKVREIMDGLRFGTADWCIMTNSDIILGPQFYVDNYDRLVKHDFNYCAWSIARRIVREKDIPKTTTPKYEDVIAVDGGWHEGHDCWLFPRRLLDIVDMGNMYYGVKHWAALLLWQFTDSAALVNPTKAGGCRMTVIHKNDTWHLWNDEDWTSNSRKVYTDLNAMEIKRVAVKMTKELKNKPRGYVTMRYLKGGTPKWFSDARAALEKEAKQDGGEVAKPEAVEEAQDLADGVAEGVAG